MPIDLYDMLVIVIYSVGEHPWDSVCLRKLPLTKAKRYLEDVIAHKQAIPFRRYCGGVGRLRLSRATQMDRDAGLPSLLDSFLIF